ncbi:hypothetical protein L1987_27400 [Smallanthus sonchifolius]|uniref:Uncharacterized protein n=1 Tax=Smallanthus sonchifolius TaxID=185202 RepID=A0ACB9IBT5_9ASTR|nr:hypothetical protein L1987_27400 [Smallanthus sonchifolius]
MMKRTTAIEIDMAKGGPTGRTGRRGKRTIDRAPSVESEPSIEAHESHGDDGNASKNNATNPSVELYEKPTLEQEVWDAIAEEVAAILKATLPTNLKETTKDIDIGKNEASWGEARGREWRFRANRNDDSDE